LIKDKDIARYKVDYCAGELGDNNYPPLFFQRLQAKKLSMKIKKAPEGLLFYFF